VTLKFGLEVTQGHDFRPIFRRISEMMQDRVIVNGRRIVGLNCTIRNLVCGFLFAFHSNYGSILHHLGDTAKYWSKIVIFSYPLAFDAPIRGIPVGIVP